MNRAFCHRHVAPSPAVKAIVRFPLPHRIPGRGFPFRPSPRTPCLYRHSRGTPLRLTQPGICAP
jgi:hypothetical protein